MQDQTEQTLLAKLAERAGIAADYHDIEGNLHLTSDDTRRAILTAMGFAVDSTASLTQALRDWDEAPWQRPCDIVIISHDADTFSESGKKGLLGLVLHERESA
jgi:4-alpha-glucanotransferase